MELEHALALRDLTDPSAGPHALQLIVSALEGAVASAWSVPVRRDPGPRIVAVTDNYDRLRYRPDAVTRDRRYTRYVDSGRMLRSHTTARIPALLDTVTADVLLSVPGICYRRDAIGRNHVGEPHQHDLWLIRRDPLTDTDLVRMIGAVCAAVLPGRPWTTVPNVRPYTVDGREIYVDGVEVGECGLAHPEVLPAGWHGLAMGLGLDRLTMLAKGIDDIRLLRSTDPRVRRQLTDLAPYQPVSAMPPVRRDLSVAVPSDLDAELLGDRVRSALGDDARSVEEVSVLSSTAHADLPPAARDRLGLREGQKNLLVRIVLRDVDRTLTTAEANALRDRVYAALHEGSVHEWATPWAPLS